MNMTEAYPRRRAYGEDLRRLAVMAVLEEGMSLAAAGRRFGVSGVSVASWVKRWRERRLASLRRKRAAAGRPSS